MYCETQYCFNKNVVIDDLHQRNEIQDLVKKPIISKEINHI